MVFFAFERYVDAKYVDLSVVDVVEFKAAGILLPRIVFMSEVLSS